jgi:hypothetical protein
MLFVPPKKDTNAKVAVSADRQGSKVQDGNLGVMPQATGHQQIPARVFSKPPGFKTGVAPTSLATQAPIRLATSFMLSSEAPQRYSWTRAAVNASPAPTVSATFTRTPGCAWRTSAVSNRLPRSPRVMHISLRWYRASRSRAEDSSSSWFNGRWFNPRWLNPRI